jgi:type I restriction enzyme, S subunit
VRRGETDARLDPQFLKLKRRKDIRYANPRYPLVKIGTLADFIQYGISERANTEGAGVPMIRMNNLQSLGWDFSDLKYIELDENILSKYRLELGDILFNRTNSKELVGKSEVFKEHGDWVFASYLIRVKMDSRRALPEFVSAFLNTEAGRIQIDQVSRQIAGMSNVNAEELRDLEVPLPDISTQCSLISDFLAQVSNRDMLLFSRNTILNELEKIVEKILGLPSVSAGNPLCYATSRRAIAQRADPFFHSPRFVALERSISAVQHVPLSSIVEFSNRTWDPKTEAAEFFEYIEISGVDRRTGSVKTSRISVSDAPSRARMITKRGDILVSLTRPHHGSIALLDDKHDGCIASTGFAVICNVDTDRTSARFVWTMLRLSICLDQMLRRSSGGNYPAITQEELSKVLIPLPDKATQQRICDEVERRHVEARRLEEEAQLVWQAARQRFEDQLLGGVAP